MFIVESRELGPTELRAYRRELILQILSDPGISVGSQADLVRLLGERGIEVTQSSISRDLQALQVERVNGRYQVVEWSYEKDPAFQRVMHLIEEAHPSGPFIFVVQTVDGAGPAVGRAIRNAAWQEVKGVLSGAETIFITTATQVDQKRVAQRFLTFLAADEEDERQES